MSSITYRWIDGPTCSDRDWKAIDLILESQGWMSMNRDTSRVYVAEENGQIVAISCLQLIPFCGPLWVDKKLRATGVAQKVADDTIGYLVEAKARGWLVVANSPHVPKLCERYKMHKVQVPVYITDEQGQVEVA